MASADYKEKKSAYTISKPDIVGFMSVDVARQFYLDLSQLKFLNDIPLGQLHLDLNHNMNVAEKRTTDDNKEQINLLLKFLLKRRQSLIVGSTTTEENEPTIVTYRRTLISIMCNACGRTEPLHIRGSLFNNCIYLCSMETPQEMKRRLSRSRQDETFCAWGYKFEQYMLSDLPSSKPDISKPVIENEEFSIYYQSQIGAHKLLYGAQMDGLLATNGTVMAPPKSDDFETNLNYLKNKHFAELKTNREIQNQRQEQNFKRYKLFRCWCQCYLADLKGLLVGYRDDGGIIQRVQWFNTDHIEEICKDEWNPQAALSYLDNILSYIKQSFRNISDSTNPRTKSPITLDFHMGSHGISATLNSKLDAPLLPDWYTNVN